MQKSSIKNKKTKDCSTDLHRHSPTGTEKMEKKEVIIYTDGGCEPNPGIGGYGAILIYGKHKKELSGGFQLTTNNRMEVYAAIVALEALKDPCKVILHTDSKYLAEAINSGWIQRWENKDWKKVKNPDLWKRLLLLTRKHEVKFVWVKGHAGNPNNERCDMLANEAIQSNGLIVDEYYENLNDKTDKVQGNIPRTDKQIHSNYGTKGKSKVKITEEGQPCRKCSTPVVKRTSRKKSSSKRSYYYEYFFACPECKTLYMVDEAKKYYGHNENMNDQSESKLF